MTISFVHQNQGEVLLHIAVPIKGSPTEVHRAQGQMKEIQTQRALHTPGRHCPASSTLYFTLPLTLQSELGNFWESIATFCSPD